jgi:release factor glutamine methyltransferase
VSGAPTIAAALDSAARRLAAAAIPEPRREARLLLGEAAALGIEALLAYPERSLAAAAAMRFETLVARRAAREPLAQILGRREFWSLSFEVTRDTLVPRPESETLVEAGLALVTDRDAPLRLLDLGTGTGCLLLALLSELPRARGLGIDLSAAALAVAERNAAALGLAGRAEFALGDWGAASGRTFDLVVSNPPYVPEADIATLEPEVARHEPALALAGGPDGLACYRALARSLPGLLAPGGRAALEVGLGQMDAVAGIMAAAGLAEQGRRLDLAGIPRCLIIAPAPLTNS